MISLSIDGIAAGGDGVGRHPDGRVMFVPRSAPGDVVEVEEVERRKRHGRGRLLRVVDAGPGRTAPDCNHYTREQCGGCQLQHLTGEVQRRAKARIVGDALRRIGKLTIEDPAVVPSPQTWHYRSKISLAVQGSAIGFHQAFEGGRVFELEDCLIARKSVIDLWDAVRPHRELLPERVESVVLKEDRAGRRHLVACDGRGGNREDAGRPWDAAPLAAALGDDTVSLWWRPWGGAERVVAGPRTGFPALAFEQINPELAVTIRSEAVEALGDVDGDVVWDLYGGVGDTASLLAARGASVWSVDSDRAAKEWAQRRQEAGVKHVVGLVERTIGGLPPPRAVVANPPRSGLAAPVTAWLDRWASAHRAFRMVYVSCDPATLARDLARMPAFTLEGVTAYDLFPHTSHVETVAVLSASP